MGLVVAFLAHAAATADNGTLLVLGLWGVTELGIDHKMYGANAHKIVAGSIAASHKAAHGNVLADALPYGYERAGVLADYGFYMPYEEAGYGFRTTNNSSGDLM